jgi:hypothetical protein
MTTALEGIKELGLSRNLPASFCTMILGEEILVGFGCPRHRFFCLRLGNRKTVQNRRRHWVLSRVSEDMMG